MVGGYMTIEVLSMAIACGIHIHVFYSKLEPFFSFHPPAVKVKNSAVDFGLALASWGTSEWIWTLFRFYLKRDVDFWLSGYRVYAGRSLDCWGQDVDFRKILFYGTSEFWHSVIKSFHEIFEWVDEFSPCFFFDNFKERSWFYLYILKESSKKKFKKNYFFTF